MVIAGQERCNGVPVEGNNSWERWGCGSNEVPVEGMNRGILCGDMYCDDRVCVRYDQVDRLCVIIRILTVLLTMELVILWYACALDDVLRSLVSRDEQHNVSERERDVCGAASDGGVYAARLLYNSGANGNATSLDEVNDEESSRGNLSLDRSSYEIEEEHETQDDGSSEPFVSEQNNGQPQ